MGFRLRDPITLIIVIIQLVLRESGLFSPPLIILILTLFIPMDALRSLIPWNIRLSIRPWTFHTLRRCDGGHKFINRRRQGLRSQLFTKLDHLITNECPQASTIQEENSEFPFTKFFRNAKRSAAQIAWSAASGRSIGASDRQIDLAIAGDPLAQRKQAAHQGLGPAGIEPTTPRIRDQVHNKRPGPARKPKNKQATRDFYYGH